MCGVCIVHACCGLFVFSPRCMWCEVLSPASVWKVLCIAHPAFTLCVRSQDVKLATADLRSATQSVATASSGATPLAMGPRARGLARSCGSIAGASCSSQGDIHAVFAAVVIVEQTLVISHCVLGYRIPAVVRVFVERSHLLLQGHRRHQRIADYNHRQLR